MTYTENLFFICIYATPYNISTGKYRNFLVVNALDCECEQCIVITEICAGITVFSMLLDYLLHLRMVCLYFFKYYIGPMYYLGKYIKKKTLNIERSISFDSLNIC